jgi:hypothetical protein
MRDDDVTPVPGCYRGRPGYPPNGRHDGLRCLHSPRGPVAQLAEQGTFNPKVAGSIPARPNEKEPQMPPFLRVGKRERAGMSLETWLLSSR